MTTPNKLPFKTRSHGGCRVDLIYRSRTFDEPTAKEACVELDCDSSFPLFTPAQARRIAIDLLRAAEFVEQVRKVKV